MSGYGVQLQEYLAPAVINVQKKTARSLSSVSFVTIFPVDDDVLLILNPLVELRS